MLPGGARKEFRNELLFSLLKEIPKINVIFEGFLTEGIKT